MQYEHTSTKRKFNAKMMQHDNVRPTLACRLMMGIIIMRVEDEGYLNVIRCENFAKHVGKYVE